MEDVHKVRAGIIWTLGTVITYLLAMMTVIGTYQVVTKYFSNRPSIVSEELLTYSFTWMALLVSVYVSGKKNHIHMGFLTGKITGPTRKCLEIAIDPLTFAFVGVVMVYGGISITRLTMIQTTTSLRVPTGYIYVIVPATGLSIMLFSLMNTADIMHRDFSGEGEA